MDQRALPEGQPDRDHQGAEHRQAAGQEPAAGAPLRASCTRAQVAQEAGGDHQELAVAGGHDGREEGGQQHADEAREEELRRHVARQGGKEHLASALAEGGQLGIDRATDEAQEQRPGGHDHVPEGAVEERRARAARVAQGHVAHQDVRVAEGAEADAEAAEDRQAAGGERQELGIDRAQGVAQGAEAAHVGEPQEGQQHDPDQHQAGLHDVGHDHRPVAAEPGVEQHDARGQEQAEGAAVDLGEEGAEGLAAGHELGADVGQQEQHDHQAGHGAQGEARGARAHGAEGGALEDLGDGQGAGLDRALAQAWAEGDEHQGLGQDVAREEPQGGEADRPGRAAGAEHEPGGAPGADGREGHGEGGDVATGEEVVLLGGAVPARGPDADAHGRHEVGREEEQGGHGDQSAGGRVRIGGKGGQEGEDDPETELGAPQTRTKLKRAAPPSCAPRARPSPPRARARAPAAHHRRA